MMEFNTTIETQAETLPTEASRRPIVIEREGEVFASSRDVAEFFDKRHDNVLRDIGGLLRSEETLGLRHFIEDAYTDGQNGQVYRRYLLTRDGFTLLAMGFTGSKALKFKLAYIAAFNAMEAELRSRKITFDMRDPRQLTTVALQLIEVNQELKAEVDAMRPQVEALDRIAEAHGTFCRSTAAKMLQVPPHTLIRWMRTNGWTFRRPGDTDDLAYQSKIAAGLLEHKVRTGPKPDGTEWTSTQVRVTSKGLTVLAKAFPPAVAAA